MKKLTFVVAALFAGLTSFAQTWSLDKSHAKLSYTTSHLMVSESDGYFKVIDSKITSPKNDFTDAVVEFTADVNSINTDNTDRDNHLKSPDFLDAAKYPSITFKSKSFKKVGDKKYKVIGDLTMHGVTKQVELDATFNGTAVHPYNQKTVAGFKVTGKIKRTDFGVGTSTPAAVVGDEVNLIANLEYFKD